MVFEITEKIILPQKINRKKNSRRKNSENLKGKKNSREKFFDGGNQVSEAQAKGKNQKPVETNDTLSMKNQ